MMDQHMTTELPGIERLDRSGSPTQGPTEDARPLLLVSVCALALVVGIVTGLGAVVFRDLIGLVHNLLFLGQFSIGYDFRSFTPPSPWGPLIILVPVLGGDRGDLHRQHLCTRGEGPRCARRSWTRSTTSAA